MSEHLAIVDYRVRIGINAERARSGDFVLAINGRYTPIDETIFVGESGRNFLQIFHYFPDLDTLSQEFYSNSNMTFKLKPFGILNSYVQQNINRALKR